MKSDERKKNAYATMTMDTLNIQLSNALKIAFRITEREEKWREFSKLTYL